MELWVDPSTPTTAGDGSPGAPFASLNAALERAGPGDVVLALPGIYRETVSPVHGGEPGRPLVLRSHVPHGAVVRASEPLVPSLGPGLHELVLPELARNPFGVRLAGSRRGGTCGQVFFGERRLTELPVPEQVPATPGTWCSLRRGEALLVHIPAGWAPAPLEVSVRERCFLPESRGMGHLRVEGFVFERAANQSAAAFWEEHRTQPGSVGFAAGHHIEFRNNVVRHSKTIGVDLGIGGGKERVDGVVPHDNLLVGNHIHDNGEVGVCGQRSYRTRVIGNLIERNACLSLHTVEEAGLKFHEFYDGLIEANVIRDTEAAGVWLDAVWTGARVTRNLVVNSLGSGIFIELGADRCIVDHNVVAYTRLGDGIYAHDASDVLIAHNLLFGNAHYGVYMRYVTDRPFGHFRGEPRPAGCSRNRILNNLFIDNYRGHLCLSAVAERSRDNSSEHNHFINGTQWQWEGQPFHRFCLGDNDGDLPREVVVQQQGTTDPLIDIDRWRALGYDFHSHAPSAFRITKENGAVSKGTASLGARDAYFQLRLSEEAASPLVPTLPEASTDYHGTPRGAVSAPGPFADLPAGNHLIDLHPHLP